RQMDGKVLGAGLFGFNASRGGHSAPVISRFLPDGSPDSSFGFRGTTYRDLGSGNSFFHYVKELSDQRIFAAGRFENASGFLAARYLPDGQPDSSFGDDGLVNYRADCFSCATMATAATVDDQGRYLMAGSATYGLGNVFRDATLTRLNFDGSLDTTFNFDGIVRVTLGLRHDSFEDVAVLPDGSIVACGGYEYLDNQGVGAAMVVMKFQQDGRLFSSFADTASYTLDLDDIAGNFLQVEPLVDGTILLAYQTQGTTDGDSRRVGLVKLQANGEPNASFGTQGRIELDFPGGQNYRFNGLNLLPDGKILLSGKLKSSQGDFTFLARLESDGQIDVSFANQGFHLVDDPISTTLNGAPLWYSSERLLMPGSLANHDAFSLICLDLAGNQVSISRPEARAGYVYPVPTADELNIVLPKELQNGATLQLIDMQGQVIRQKQIAKGVPKELVNVASLAGGVYGIRVFAGEFAWVGTWLKE
ncbi:MAG: T9SS type A sorting domain-containing protein, partial [Bacteroidota bacterium]